MIEASGISSEFNAFLFAAIGEQENETPLSVLSALARLDVDPWQEAARLAQLPKDQAIQGLGSMIGGLPGGRWKASESSMIAARLVELLPSRTNSIGSVDGIGRHIVLPLALMAVVFAAVLGIAVESHVPPSNTSHAVMSVNAVGRTASGARHGPALSSPHRAATDRASPAPQLSSVAPETKRGEPQ